MIDFALFQSVSSSAKWCVLINPYAELLLVQISRQQNLRCEKVYLWLEMTKFTWGAKVRWWGIVLPFMQWCLCRRFLANKIFDARKFIDGSK